MAQMPLWKCFFLFSFHPLIRSIKLISYYVHILFPTVRLSTKKTRQVSSITVRKQTMAATPFISLPAEILVSIAKLCKNDDLINLCLTSKLVKERCLPVLYRHVVLQYNPKGLGICSYQDCLQMMADLRKRQQRFVHTLLSHPEYGKHVRSLEGMLCILRLDDWQHFGAIRISEEDFWRALLSMTVIQCVDISSRFFFNDCMSVLVKQPPVNLFQSATSGRLVGLMQYRLAKLTLDGINPATLKHLSRYGPGSHGRTTRRWICAWR